MILTETNMKNQRTYNRSESIVIDGKDFHFTPDRKEFLETLTKTYPNQTSFVKEDFQDIGGMPYWVKSSRYGFKDNGIFNLHAVVSGYNGGYSEEGNVTPISAPVPALSVSNQMPVAAQTTAVVLRTTSPGPGWDQERCRGDRMRQPT